MQPYKRKTNNSFNLYNVSGVINYVVEMKKEGKEEWQDNKRHIARITFLKCYT